MTDSPWKPIDPAAWRDVPHLAGKLSSAEDVAAGRAVFRLDATQGTATPASLALPRCGLQHLDDGTARPVVVIQAEVLNGETILGVRYLPGGGGVCQLEEVELLEGPEEWLPGG